MKLQIMSDLHFEMHADGGADGAGTVVRQRMEYELKFGALGRLLDALVVKRKWNAGIRSFFGGLKRYVEGGDTKGG